jgi:hypothetical protein
VAKFFKYQNSCLPGVGERIELTGLNAFAAMLTKIGIQKGNAFFDRGT